MKRPKLRPDGFPTRNDVRYWVYPEHAIQTAIQAVELEGASPALTEAVRLLVAARERVADHLEGIPVTPGVVDPQVDGMADALRRLMRVFGAGSVAYGIALNALRAAGMEP